MAKIKDLSKSRDTRITTKLLYKSISVHDGLEYTTLSPGRAMEGHKLGEYAPTKYMSKLIHDSDRSRKRKNRLKQKRK